MGNGKNVSQNQTSIDLAAEMQKLSKFTKTYEKKIPLLMFHISWVRCDTVSKSCKFLKVR